MSIWANVLFKIKFLNDIWCTLRMRDFKNLYFYYKNEANDKEYEIKMIITRTQMKLSLFHPVLKMLKLFQYINHSIKICTRRSKI